MRRLGKQAKHEAKGQARKHAEWIERGARVGYATKGLIYAILGTLTVMTAVEGGSNAKGSQDAIFTIASQPFGQFLLGVVGLGLIGYAGWRFVQAGLDAENAGSQAKGIAKRVAYAFSGLAYASLAVMVGQILFSGGGGGGGGNRQTWIAQLLAQDWGPYVVATLGGFIIAAGVYQAYKAWTMKFEEELKSYEMSQTERKAARIVGRVGLAARAVVFPIMGVFLIQAAMSSSPSQAKGVEGALQRIAEAGTIWLAIVAAGLVAYGVLQFFFAKYRRIKV